MLFKLLYANARGIKTSGHFFYLIILALDNTLWQQDPQFSHPFYGNLFSLIRFIFSTFSFVETIAFSSCGDKGEETPPPSSHVIPYTVIIYHSVFPPLALPPPANLVLVPWSAPSPCSGHGL